MDKTNNPNLNVSIQVNMKQFAFDIARNHPRETTLELIKELERAYQSADFLEMVYDHFKSEWDKEVAATKFLEDNAKNAE